MPCDGQDTTPQMWKFRWELHDHKRKDYRKGVRRGRLCTVLQIHSCTPTSTSSHASITSADTSDYVFTWNHSHHTLHSYNPTLLTPAFQLPSTDTNMKPLPPCSTQLQPHPCIPPPFHQLIQTQNRSHHTQLQAQPSLPPPSIATTRQNRSHIHSYYAPEAHIM